MTAQEIYDAVLKYVGAVNYAEWYVGVTHNIKERLFSYHRVTSNVPHGYAEALDSNHSRSAEAALLELGFDGDTGGGSTDAKNVYVYRKVQGTVR